MDGVLSTGSSIPSEPVLAVDEIQGNVLPGFGTSHLALVGLKLIPGSEERARRWLHEIAYNVSTLRQVNEARQVRRAVAKATGTRPDNPDLFMNVVLAFSAIATFGLDTSLVEGIFKSGMGDAGFGDRRDETGPLDWVLGDKPERSPDILLIFGSDVKNVIERAIEKLRDDLDAAHTGLTVSYVERGGRLAGNAEHFGFRDDISQPGVRGRLSTRSDHLLTRRHFHPEDHRASTHARPGQPLLWPGQFIFGYPTELEDDPLSPGPIAVAPAAWMEHGSFMVYRRLQQNVAVFREFAASMAPEVSAKVGRTVSPGELQAWLVGRWPDGTPLASSPTHPDKSISEDDDRVNFFAYAESEDDARLLDGHTERTVPGIDGDRDGHRCPHFAHIRKVNLRDKTTDQGPSSRFRILRRGIPFGPPYAPGEASGIDRGLLFLSYQRVLSPQLMTLVATWMNAPDAPEGFGHDLLVGQSATPRFAEALGEGGHPLRILEAPGPTTWIVPTGGGFYFSPSTSVLQTI